MRIRNTLFTAAVIGVTATITAALVSQDPAAPDMSVLTPGEHHERLGYLAGEWDNLYTLTEPGRPPVKFTGQTSSELIYDGRFVKSTSKYDAMGMPVEDMILTGYDNFREEYIMFYVSSFGTSWTQATGQLDDEGQLIWNGTQDIPHMGQRDVKYRIVEKRIDDDHFQMEFWYESPDAEGGWHRNLVIESTRQESE